MSSRSFFSKLKVVFIRLYSLPFISWFLRLLNPVDNSKKYIFIVGCYNSGTTLLEELLGRHSDISKLPTEGNVLTKGLTRPEDFGWPRLWYKCAEDIISKEGDYIDSNRIKNDWQVWHNSNKNFYLEKSIANSAKIEWLEKEFDSPYFIWIVRDGYCVSEGIRRRSLSSDLPNNYKKTGYTIEMCATQWLVSNITIQEEIHNVKNVIEVSYEDLVNDTNKTIGDIVNWLPIRSKSTLFLQKMFEFHGKTSSIKNMNSKSYRNLTHDDISKINTIASQYLKDKKYFKKENDW
jgi:hypothetical protein